MMHKYQGKYDYLKQFYVPGSEEIEANHKAIKIKIDRFIKSHELVDFKLNYEKSYARYDLFYNIRNI